MYSRKNRKNTTLMSIDENFASIIGVSKGGEYIYEFEFYVSVAEAIKNGYQTVKISALKPDIPQQTTAQRSYDAKGIINEVLLMGSRENDKRHAAKSNVISTVFVDLTTLVNNEDATDILKDKKKSLYTDYVIDVVNKSTLGVNGEKYTSIVQPVKQTSTNVLGNKISSSEDIRSLSIEMIKSGLDPACIANSRRQTSGPFSNFTGTKTLSTTNVINDVSSASPIVVRNEKLVNSLISTSDNVDEADFVVPVIKQQEFAVMKYSRRMLINSFLLNTINGLNVKFELLGNELAVEAHVKTIDHIKLLNFFLTPKSPPVILGYKIANGKNVITMQQVDSSATSIRLDRKIIKNTIENKNADSQEYQTILTANLSKNDAAIRYEDNVNNLNDIVYRCISIGSNGKFCSEFSSTLIKGNAKYRRSNIVSMNSTIIQEGIKITIVDIPYDAVEITVIKKDLTINENSFTRINFDDNYPRVAIDKNVKKNHIYEYRCKIFYRDGISDISSTALYEKYIPLVVNDIEIDITDFKTIANGNSYDIVFNINSVVEKRDLSLIQNALEKQNLLDIFSDELKLQREDLQKLIAHSIKRVDINTGEIVDFGVFVDSFFIDSTESKKRSAPFLKNGHSYKYSITTLLRQAETVFKDSTVIKKDSTSGKKYISNYMKKLHPLTVESGILVDDSDKNVKNPEGIFTIGNIGNLREIFVSIPGEITHVINVSAERINKRTVKILWNIQGNVHAIDHFIVLKESNKNKTIIGKAFNRIESRVFEYIDTIGLDDIGELAYYVIQVNNDYSRNVEIKSNTLIINDARNAPIRRI